MDSKRFSLNLFLFVIVVCPLRGALCFDVQFRENYNVHVQPFNTQIYKREMAQSHFDRAAYTFNGFEKIESIPVTFPLDICILNLPPSRYAACLHRNTKGVKNFSLYRMQNGSYDLIADIATPQAIAMDCKSLGPRGYIALACNTSQSIQNAQEGSPIFELYEDKLRRVQYFPAPNLRSVYLRVSGNDLFLLQTFANTEASPNLNCPYFKWTGSSFNRWGSIPCSNARHLEPFSIDYVAYVAVANYANQQGRPRTYSEIYKYSAEKKRFQLHQKIRTYGAVDVKYFSVPYDEVSRKHFLVFGNSLDSKGNNASAEGNAIFYMFDRGQFVPYQRLGLYKVEQFLPVQNVESEKFLMLVACQNQDIKIYNLNDWKFEESSVQFTAGSLSRGVSKMRIHLENDNSYLVIANELMMGNETNVFLPIFKQDEQANALRQEIIEWSKAQVERLQSLDIAALQKAVEAKLSQFQRLKKKPLDFKAIPKANVQKVVTKLLIYPRLHMTTSYWKSLSFATQALNTLEKSSKAGKRPKRDLSPSGNDVDEIEVGELRVNKNLRANWVNGVQGGAALKLDEIQAEKIVVSGEYSSASEPLVGQAGDVIDVEHLVVRGKFNGRNWSELVNNTLKRQGDVQFLKAPVNITNLRASSVVVTDNAINSGNLRKLVPSQGNATYVINQDIQFAEPVRANRVVISERLNNIHVFQGKLDVLLKRSNETQIVEGPKRLESLKVLEPVSIAGELMGKHLKDMSPNKAIHEPLTLNGDFVIDGDVTIGKLLQVEKDIHIQNGTISLREMLEKAVDMQQPVENVNLKFEQPLVANNTVVSFVNKQDVQHLLATESDDVVVVKGKKVFGQNLRILEGLTEVKHLNGHDVEAVAKRLLLRNSNETVRVPIHFGTIIAKGVNSSAGITLGGKNLSEFLTYSGSQHVRGALRTDKLRANQLEVEDLNTDGPIFGHSIHEIYQQKARNSPQPQVFEEGHKFHGTVYVQNLYLNTSINGRAVEQLENQLGQLQGNVKYVGNFKFNYNISIGNLTYGGEFNGVPAAEWGRYWLVRQSAGQQVFSQPQVIGSMRSQRGLRLDGKLNGLTLEDFTYGTCWVNRNEYIANAVFESPIEIQGFLAASTLNGLQVPGDMLYKSSALPQVLFAAATVNGSVYVTGSIDVLGSVNNVNLPQLRAYLDGGHDTLHVEKAHFVNGPPSAFATLNRHNLTETLDAAWMANEDVILRNAHVEIAEANVDGLIAYNGQVNQMDMPFVREHYFSLSRPQEIPAQHILMQSSLFEGGLQAEELQALGPIVVTDGGGGDAKGSSAFINFDEFVSNTLKNSGPHEIRAQWNLSSAVIHGDFYGLVNGLNFADDVLSWQSSSRPVITAPKHLASASIIARLYATPQSLVQGIPVAQWVTDAVYAYENYTIRGNTTLDVVNVYNDLRVLGLVNGRRFDEDSLLLRNNDQILRKDVYIRNKFDEEQRILANNFELLTVNSVNGRNFPEFLASCAKVQTPLEIESNLVFTVPVVARQFQSSGGNANKWKRQLSQAPNDKWQSLDKTLGILTAVKEDMRHLKEIHLELRQILAENISKIVPFKFEVKKDILVDFIGCFVNGDQLVFYRWSEKRAEFIPDRRFPAGKAVTAIIKAAGIKDTSLDRRQFEEIHRNANKKLSKDIWNLTQKEKCNLLPLNMGNHHCLASYACRGTTNASIHCVDSKSEGSSFISNLVEQSSRLQIVPLADDRVAALHRDRVEIWSNRSKDVNLKQSLSAVRPLFVAHTNWKSENASFLAIATEARANSTKDYSSVVIYRSLDSAAYEYQNTLQVPRTHKMSFTQRSDRVLLIIFPGNEDMRSNYTVFELSQGADSFVQLSSTYASDIVQNP